MTKSRFPKITPEDQRPGRPRHDPTDRNRELVRELAGYGIPQKDIARLIKTGIEQLTRDYREELDAGSAEATAKVAKNLFRIATSPDISGPTVAAAIFWAKARMGWKELPQQFEHTVRLQRIERVYIDPQEEPDSTLLLDQERLQ